MVQAGKGLTPNHAWGGRKKKYNSVQVSTPEERPPSPDLWELPQFDTNIKLPCSQKGTVFPSVSCWSLVGLRLLILISPHLQTVEKKSEFIPLQGDSLPFHL